VSVDSGRVQGLALGLGCSAHPAKVGAIPDLWPQPGGYSRGEQLGRVVHQHGVVAGGRQTGTGLGVDVDAQEAAPAALEIPRCILDDLAGAEAVQWGDLQVEHDDRRAGRERVEQRPQPAGVVAPEGSSGPDRGREPRRLRYRRG